MYPPPVRQRLIAGWGAVSDDTAQSALVLLSLARHPDDPVAFQADFGRRVRVWFLSAPPGIGLATVKACLRLVAGVPAARSGVNSAGNGAAMRAAVLGSAFRGDPTSRVAFVEAASGVTHTHPLAIQGAQLIALAAATSRDEFDAEARRLAPDWPFEARWPESGPNGYVVPSVNASLEIWRSSPDFPSAIERAIRLGGDTDTVGAMVGGIMGPAGAPQNWNRIFGWPQTRDEDAIRRGARTPYVRMLATHAATLPIILGHGFRRLLPPYDGVA